MFGPNEGKAGSREKIQVLRAYERVSYQIAFCLLQDPDKAVEICQRGFLALFPEEDFFRLPDKQREKKIRHVIMMECAKDRVVKNGPFLI